MDEPRSVEGSSRQPEELGARPAARRIGDFRFDPASGELERVGEPSGANGREATRLAPQPARLLELLASRPGELVPHEEIREQLWPDVQVDFERGLHFAIRQIRSVLGDSPSAPRYVENLPRRGYRLIAEVTAESDQPSGAGSELRSALGPEASAGRRSAAETPRTIPSETSAPRSPGARWPVPLLAVLLAAAVVVVIVVAVPSSPADRATVAAEGPRAPSLAIMSFRAPNTGDAGRWADIDGERVALLLLERLSGFGVEELAVMGPSTTEAYGEGLGEVARLLEERPIDWVINGRYSSRGNVGGSDDAETSLTVLVELIRRDGAHVWVERFAAPRSAQPEEAAEIARQVGDAVVEALALRPSRAGGS